MFDLFVSELKRYRLIALLFAIIQLAAWGFLSKIQMILLPSSEKHASLVLLSIVAGGLFAIVSVGLHKRKNNWTYLVHRPLAIEKIHLSFSAAGLCLLFVAIHLPFLMVIGCLDIFTDNVVEVRHYLYVLHLFLISANAYFLSQFAVLHPNKAAFSVLWILTYIMLRQHTPPSYELAVDGVLFCLSAFAAHHAFRVNLSSYSSKPLFTVVAVLLLQPAMLMAFIIFQGIYYHIPINILGLSPLSQKPDGQLPSTFKAYSWQGLSEQGQQLLTLTNHPQAKSISRQLNLSEFKALDRNRLRLPYKNGLFMNDHSRNFMLTDQPSDSFWVFSHTQMVFVGRSFQSEKTVGFLGKNGFIALGQSIVTADRFEQVAVPTSTNYIQTKDTLYRVDFDNKKLVLKHQLAAGEFYRTQLNSAFDLVSLMSNKATYLFNKITFLNNNSIATALHRVNHPTAIDDYLTMDITELSNGFVALYSSYYMGGIEKPGAALTYIPHQGKSELLVKHTFTETLHPNLITQQKFMLSPILLNVIDTSISSPIQFSHEPPKLLGYFWQRDIPKEVLIFCIGAALFSGLITWLLATKIKLSNRTRFIWLAINLICALPGLVAFIILNNWRLMFSNHPTNAQAGNP